MNTTPALYAETRPADFHAKIGRPARGMGVKRRFGFSLLKSGEKRLLHRGPHRGRRFAALAAAIAVPAMAAPGDWQPFQRAEASLQMIEQVLPMPFEQAGYSFPGSAFYYLADTPQLSYDFEADPAFSVTYSDDIVTAAEPAQLAETRNAGPAARSFRLAGMGVDKARALQCLTMAVYYEAASESIDGQRAVAQVVLNRVSHPSYPTSVCGVVFQGSERRTGCQFSFTCDGSLARRPGRGSWVRAQGVAQRALTGEVFTGVGLATHYHTTAINPYWASSLDSVGIIGAHIFYKWRGSAGRPSAFRSAHRGSEPMAGPKPRSSAAAESVNAADPLALARAYEAGRSTGIDVAAPSPAPSATPSRAPAPVYNQAITQSGGDEQFTAQNLPDSGDVKEEYSGSGRWLRDPGAPQ